MLITETVFLTNIVNKAYTGFYTLKMDSGKRLKYQYKQILDPFLDFYLPESASSKMSIICEM